MGESSKNSPSKKSAKRKKNTTSIKGSLQTKIMNGEVDTSQTKTDAAVNEEEQSNIISDFSDDSDIEVISHVCSGEIAMVNSKTAQESTSQFEILENSPCNSPTSSKNEIILVDLSETSDDEESDNSINDAVQYESQINGAQNEILEESEASDDQIRFEIKTDDLSIDIFQEPNLKIEELELESDEECMMFDFSNYTADDVLKAVENDKLMVKEFHSIIKKKFQKSSRKNNTIDNSIDSVKQVTLEKNIESSNEKKVNENSEKDSIIDNSEDGDNQAALVLNLDHPYSVSTPAITDRTVSDKSDVVISKEVLSSDKLSETISSYIASTCRDCSLAQNLDINKLNKICDSCKRPLLLQCKVCLSSFFSMSLACTHLWKFHDVKIQPSELLARSEFISVEKANSPVIKNQSDSANDSKCDKCGIQCSLLTNVDKHKTFCKTIVNYSCKFCSTKMIFKKDLKNHMLLEHRRLFKRTELNDILDSIMKNSSDHKGAWKFMRVSCLACGMRAQPKSTESSCDYCGGAYVNECVVCKGVYKTRKSLRMHVMRKHAVKWFRCSACKLGFHYQSDLRMHYRNCSARAPSYACPNCFFVTKYHHSFIKHVRTLPCSETQVSRDCPRCGRYFQRLSSFYSHIANQCGKAREYSCDQCDYKSYRKYQITRHLNAKHKTFLTAD